MIVNPDKSHIYVTPIPDPRADALTSDFWNDRRGQLPWIKYQIKESDFRTKTASFTTNSEIEIDLTIGLIAVAIISPYHENFYGIILSDDYDEENETHTYQCQDWSRRYQSKIESWYESEIYAILIQLLSRGEIAIEDTNNKKVLDNGWWPTIGGLRAKWKFDQKLLGNIINTNPMKNKVSLVIRNTSLIEAIRDICFGYVGYVDVYFNSVGQLQIVPLARDDWYNTGLHLSLNQTMKRSFKFDTTNAITGVTVNESGLSLGKSYLAEDLIGLNLNLFFGIIFSSMDKPNNTGTSSGNSTSNSTTNSNKATVSTNGNPYNNKAKKILISADSGSGADEYKAGIIKLLERDGWKVKDVGTWSDAHSVSYRSVTSDYAVNFVIYNGLCAGTIREAYGSSIQSIHKNAGCQLISVWDSSDWTSKNMKQMREGNLLHVPLKRAHDDNFSASDPYIPDIRQFFEDHNAVWICNPTSEGAYEEFKAGGYLKWAKQ